MTVKILAGHVLDVLATLPDKSVQCCVTSPPYYGLRAYNTPPQTWPDGWVGELGQEPTLALYLDHLLSVFDAVWRVLKDDGTCWVNIADSYASSGGVHKSGSYDGGTGRKMAGVSRYSGGDGLKPKDLMLVPHRFAIAMQDRGWWVRNDCIWAKTACMPESVRDRATRSHEYIFHFAKSARYFYDGDAVREPQVDWERGATGERIKLKDERPEPGVRNRTLSEIDRNGNQRAYNPLGRNQRTVWTIGPEPLRDEHYAAFPSEIPRRCILAGTSERGGCAKCGAPWRRVVERETAVPQRNGEWKSTGQSHRNDIDRKGGFYDASSETLGWQPSCQCDAGDPVPQTVLDPFGGSGTTGIVADRLGRDAILIELGKSYVEMAERRVRGDAPLFASVEIA